MPQFRKKPIEISAIQYVGETIFMLSPKGVPDWIQGAFENGTLYLTNGTDPLRIKTLEGQLTVSPNDWIIRGISGEIYPCKSDIFEKTYDLISD